MTDNKVSVLDRGYVRLVKYMGDDLDVVNSAKVSFDKEATSFEEREARLLAFLARESHTSVFRHSALTYEVYAPLIIARQWWKYAVASSHVEDQLGWNESSRRYITETPEFYVVQPNEWRSAPDDRKQGSGPLLTTKDGQILTNHLVQVYSDGLENYEYAINEMGVAPEQARLFLPAYGLYVRWRWTASLGAVMHFLQQRLEHAAQKEIFEFARAVESLTKVAFPNSIGSI